MVLLTLLLAAALARPTPEQWLVVVTPDWDADAGTATLYEEGQVVLGPVPIRVGHAGLGWGQGLHPEAARPGPTKKEGDGRAPAGIFQIGPQWTRFWSRGSFCVDDSKSASYGQIVTLGAGQKASWSSAETMVDYRVAIVVEHNPAHRKLGGSCIFLHDGTEPTVGCTAFEQESLDVLAGRLVPGAKLVQLPRVEYARYQGAWGLP
ncbi:MAG: D-alanyl-D-alanine dipeptidase [Myxococcota bacterium]|jgi:D-alanyl-D-alanine dipeptidase